MGVFYNKVYNAVQRIPHGRVATYGQIALMAGNPKAARAVGWALHVNPQPSVIPCHRIVNKDGRLTPAFAFGGAGEQRRLLEAEGVHICSRGIVDLEQYGWRGEAPEKEST